MKNIMLITIREEICEMYTAELRGIFDGYVNIHSFSFENKLNKPFDRSSLNNKDLILVTASNVHSLIRNYLDESTPVIYINFTFMQDKIDLLKAYPRDTNAYIGFKSYSVSYQTISLLYELGLNNLNLRVYDPDHTDIKDIDIAITSENSSSFPEEVRNIISIGKRKISFMTIMDITICLSIMDDGLERRIYSYCDGTAVHDNCLNYFYDKSSNVKVQLQTIINCIDDAFIMLNHNYIVLNYNNQLLNMFKTNSNILNTSVFELPEFSAVFEHIKSERELKNELVEICGGVKKILLSKETIKDRDNKYNIYILIIKDVTNVINLENTLRRQLAKKGHIAKYSFENIKGNSSPISSCIEKAKKIAVIDKPTLIIGESGTGKELFAQSIHNSSQRRKFPFVAINCAALAPSLLESELFGYEEGSFTGAKKGGKIGLFEMSHRGTLFLDEICEMSLETQAKLLRVLEEKEIMKVGGSEVISIDVRIIAATNRDVKESVNNGSFRLDLYYRLNTVMIRIPPLRERSEDIKVLAHDFLMDMNYQKKEISSEVMNFMLSYPWPGNIRELKNCMEYMSSISENVIRKEHLPEYMLTDNTIAFTSGNEEATACKNVGFHDHEAAIRILEILLERNIGRKKLLELLHSENIFISEYRLRSILDNLSSNSYVYYKKGRSGVIITTHGKNALINRQI